MTRRTWRTLWAAFATVGNVRAILTDLMPETSDLPLDQAAHAVACQLRLLRLEKRLLGYAPSQTPGTPEQDHDLWWVIEENRRLNLDLTHYLTIAVHLRYRLELIRKLGITDEAPRAILFEPHTRRN